jgi:hypothetical protein
LAAVKRLDLGLLVHTQDDGMRASAGSFTLDINDTCDVVHSHQQLSLFNAHYDERCLLPVHLSETQRSRPVVAILRPDKTPEGVEARAHLLRLARRIRARRPTTRITFRGDGHYARREAMRSCKDNGIDYIFGPPGSGPLTRKVESRRHRTAERAVEDKVVVAGSWRRERRAVARIEATPARPRHPQPSEPDQAA